MIEELWLDGKLVDLPPRRVSQTYQINDLAELKDRQLNYTNRFKIGFTPTNVQLMDYLGIVGNKSLKPYRKISAKYIVNGVELMPNGFAVVKKTEGAYEVNIYDGNADLYETLKGRRINQLNFQDLNHSLTTALYGDSIDNTSGYIYGLGHFGFSNYGANVNIERQAPSLYVHTLFNKIMTEAGKTYSGDVFQDPEFLREVVPPTLGYDINATPPVGVALGDIQSNLLSRNEISSDPLFFDDKFDISSSGGLTQSSISNNGIDISFTGVLKLGLQLTHTLNFGFVSFHIKKNGNIIVDINLQDGSAISTIQDFSVQVENGDRIEFFLSSFTYEPSDPELGLYRVDVTADFDCSLEEVTGGIFIDFNLIMPNSSQIEFIKDVMQRYGLMFQTGVLKNHYDFFKMETLLNDRDNAEDWSDKLAGFGGEDYSIGSYAQRNLMKYQYPEGVEDALLDGSLDVDNDNLADEKTLFSSIYTISERIGFKNSIEIYTVPIWEEVDEDGVMVVNNLESKFRIFKIIRDNSTINISITGVAGTVAVTGDIPYLSLDNLSFDYYSALNYPAFNRVLDRQLKRTPRLKLTPIDIYNLDFSTLKYFEQFGQYFYLNKISNYIPGKTVVAEIIQAVGITINQPPSQLGSNRVQIVHGLSKTLKVSDFTGTEPPYVDPEFDQPERIKILSDFNNDVLLNNNGELVGAGDIILVATMDLVLVSNGSNSNAHEAQFDFQIQSFNNPLYSSQIGSIIAEVFADTPLAPIAEAGTNRTLYYNSDTEPDGGVSLFGCASYDPNGDPLTYLWTLEGSVPPEIVLSVDNLCQGEVIATGLTFIHNGLVITAKLRVEDPGLLFSEDTITITLIDLNPNPA